MINKTDLNRPRPKWAVKEEREQLALSSMQDIQPKATEWLWKDRIPLGEISSIDGDPASNKSSLVLDLAARVSMGSAMPDGSPGVHGEVLLILGEDSIAKTVRKRLEAAKANLNNILVPQEPWRLDRDLRKIEEAICRTAVKLVIIDPLMTFLGADANNDQKVRSVLTPLQTVVDKTNCAVVFVRHLNKKSGGSVMYRAGGSIGIVAAIRSSFLVARHPSDPDLRVMAHYKSNLGPLTQSLLFEPVDCDGSPTICWRGECELTAADLTSKPTQNSSRLSEAMSFLKEQLVGEPVEQGELKRRALEKQISFRTLERAKEVLGVVSVRQGFGPGSCSCWYMPK